ncbi:hypothetical protein CDD81_7599 [Ophiocordyceps australis]|uniref:Prefoldin subunit 6 n=1 Tax=Ophiocordyceps australis TaxID=1399860 RepID=A0A2C5Y317_9HYPO|nr:hypothetical protein CDD81_7599 [Ophiocordyceps australis]
MAETQAHMQSLSDEFQKLQEDLQQIVASRQQLEGQKQENVGVQKEFDKLGEEETIYKLVGPVLLQQDKVEAESTVKGRLDFIGSEIERLEKQIKETQDKLEKKKMEIVQAQATAGSGGAPAGS